MGNDYVGLRWLMTCFNYAAANDDQIELFKAQFCLSFFAYSPIFCLLYFATGYVTYIYISVGLNINTRMHYLFTDL